LLNAGIGDVARRPLHVADEAAVVRAAPGLSSRRRRRYLPHRLPDGAWKASLQIRDVPCLSDRTGGWIKGENAASPTLLRIQHGAFEDMGEYDDARRNCPSDCAHDAPIEHVILLPGR
jgi:hypothetical protein